MPFSHRAEPFNHVNWVFEIKWDGFRALLYSDNDGVRLISRNRNTFKSFPDLCKGLARDLKGRRCTLDGEIVCLDSQGKPHFQEPAIQTSRTGLLCIRYFVGRTRAVRR